MPTASATRSVVVGLLLAALSAGSLIAFSLFAGDADNPSRATVAATRPSGDVPPVVLGTRIAREDQPASPSVETSPTEARPDPVSVTGDTVLGTRIRAAGNGKAVRRDGGEKRRSRQLNRDARAGDRNDKPLTLGRRPSSSNCPCDRRPAKSPPNGNAYGRDKGRGGPPHGSGGPPHGSGGPPHGGSGNASNGAGHGPGDQGGGPPSTPPGKARGRGKKP